MATRSNLEVAVVGFDSNAKRSTCLRYAYEVKVGVERIGKFYMDTDGYWVYEPHANEGHLDSCLMRAIADKLDEMNEEWDKQVREQLSLTQIS